MSILNDSDFYGSCIYGSIRRQVADSLMESVPALRKLKGKDYYFAEDVICSFIEKNASIIYDHFEGVSAIDDCKYFLGGDNLAFKDEATAAKFAERYLHLLNDRDELYEASSDVFAQIKDDSPDSDYIDFVPDSKSVSSSDTDESSTDDDEQ